MAHCLHRRLTAWLSFTTLLGASFIADAAAAELRLPAVFSDHMVLQRGRDIAVWGWAEKGEQITAILSEQTKSTAADDDGQWRIAFDALPAGGPHKLVVEGGSGGRVQVEDVLIGEVWLCSGQSNMAMAVNRASNADAEIAAAEFPKLRMFTVGRKPSDAPLADCSGQWDVCSPQTVSRFSATAYFFGRELHQTLGVPIGLVNSSVGGTAIEAWTSYDVQESVDELAPVLAPWRERIESYDPAAAQAAYEKALAAWPAKVKQARAAGRQPPRKPRAPVAPRLDSNHPANLYNGMIAPLVGYGIRGAIWYQGERNANGSIAPLYDTQLAVLIGDWRQRWGQGDFPVYYVQLPNFHQPQSQPAETTPWVLVREGMFNALSTPNTGMAVTVDIGEAGDIHPKNKQDVGKRLALWALAKTYDRDVQYSGPLFRAAHRKDGRMAIEFAHSAGLASKDGGELQGFAIAGEDGGFVWAEAKIVGETVEVSSPQVKSPAAVRYAWADNPRGNLTNESGLPAAPFRTDP